MTERRQAGRPSDVRSQARPIQASRQPIADWAEDQQASARERLQVREVPRPKQPYAGSARGFWLRVIVVLVAVALLAFALRARASEGRQAMPIAPHAVRVIDGDTIQTNGLSYRLVGFDAPETGNRAECQAEIDRGWRAYARLVDLVWSGRPLTLERITCSCARGIDGTMLCNYGRRCGTLRIAGQDVGTILTREGLAKPYPYRWPHPPSKPRWCS